VCDALVHEAKHSLAVVHPRPCEKHVEESRRLVLHSQHRHPAFAKVKQLFGEAALDVKPRGINGWVLERNGARLCRDGRGRDLGCLLGKKSGTSGPHNLQEQQEHSVSAKHGSCFAQQSGEKRNAGGGGRGEGERKRECVCVWCVCVCVCVCGGGGGGGVCVCVGGGGGVRPSKANMQNNKPQ
jgi:hypothetical protein